MPGWHGVPAGFVGAQYHRAPAKPALKPAQAWNAGSCCQYFNHP